MQSDDTRRLTSLIDEVRQEVGDLVALLPTAYERQWTPARVQTRVGSPPLHADPTGETATDPRRLKVRAEVLAAERAVEETAATLREARARLGSALEGWAGFGA